MNGDPKPPAPAPGALPPAEGDFAELKKRLDAAEKKNAENAAEIEALKKKPADDDDDDDDDVPDFLKDVLE